MLCAKKKSNKYKVAYLANIKRQSAYFFALNESNSAYLVTNAIREASDGSVIVNAAELV